MAFFPTGLFLSLGCSLLPSVALLSASPPLGLGLCSFCARRRSAAGGRPLLLLGILASKSACSQYWLLGAAGRQGELRPAASGRRGELRPTGELLGPRWAGCRQW